MVVHFAYPHPVDGHAFLPASRPGHLSLKHEVATEKNTLLSLYLFLRVIEPQLVGWENSYIDWLYPCQKQQDVCQSVACDSGIQALAYAFIAKFGSLKKAKMGIAVGARPTTEQDHCVQRGGTLNKYIVAICITLYEAATRHLFHRKKTYVGYYITVI